MMYLHKMCKTSWWKKYSTVLLCKCSWFRAKTINQRCTHILQIKNKSVR